VVFLILGGVSGCSGGRSAFQVESEDRYRIIIISSIERGPNSWASREEHPPLTKVSDIPNICKHNVCIVTKRIPAWKHFPDSNNGVSGEIVENQQLRQLGYTPHNISLSDGQAYVLVPIPKPNQ
jgi:hypothetical protein